MSKPFTKIGTVTITKPTKFVNQSEFARWYDEIEVQPQTIDLLGEVDKDGKVKDASVHFVVSGPVVSSDWSPCFGGVPFANGNDKNLGEVKTHYESPYAHAMAGAIVEGKTTNWAQYVKLEGFAAKRVDFVYDGEAKHTYEIAAI